MPRIDTTGDDNAGHDGENQQAKDIVADGGAEDDAPFAGMRVLRFPEYSARYANTGCDECRRHEHGSIQRHIRLQ